MKKIFVIAICLPLFLIASGVSAHQPRLVESDTVEVENPEVSQAFYGNFNGAPVNYKIQSDQPFSLYVGLLVPDIPGIKKDVSAEIYKEEGGQAKLIAVLDGLNNDWLRFHEEFANDDYFWGPEFKADGAGRFTPQGRPVEAGVYTIKVFRPGNLGKYVLVVGEKELFPPKEMLNAILLMPALKMHFFAKPFWLIFYSRIGFYLAIPLAALIFIIVAAAVIIKKIRKKIKK